MNQKMAKRLRKLARDEMSANGNVVERELVLARVHGGDRVINEPMSNRAMYLKLKWAYGESRRKSISQIVASEA